MDPTDLPEDEAALEAQRDFLLLFRQAIEHGSHVAREIFDRYHGMRDQGLFAHLLRWQANEYLRTQGQELVQFVQEKVNGSGLSFLVKGAHMRSWKAVDGEMPVARTRRVRDFCRQVVQLTLPFPDLDQIGPVTENFALLWNLDGKQNVAMIEMLKPRTGGVRAGEKYWVWRIKVPDFFTPAQPSQLEQIDDSDDLPEIGLPDVDVNPDAAAGNSEGGEDD